MDYYMNRPSFRTLMAFGVHSRGRDGTPYNGCAHWSRRLVLVAAAFLILMPASAVAGEGRLLTVSQSGASSVQHHAYEDFVRALETYVKTPASSTAEASRVRSKKRNVLESTARMLASQGISAAQHDALLTRLNQAREDLAAAPTTSSPEASRLRTQRRTAVEAIEFVLGLR